MGGNNLHTTHTHARTRTRHKHVRHTHKPMSCYASLFTPSPPPLLLFVHPPPFGFQRMGKGNSAAEGPTRKSNRKNPADAELFDPSQPSRLPIWRKNLVIPHTHVAEQYSSTSLPLVRLLFRLRSPRSNLTSLARPVGRAVLPLLLPPPSARCWWCSSPRWSRTQTARPPPWLAP